MQPLLSSLSLSLPERRSSTTRAVACNVAGTGLSGALLTKLQLPWIGLDISSDMLQVNTQQQQQQQERQACAAASKAK